MALLNELMCMHQLEISLDRLLSGTNIFALELNVIKSLPDLYSSFFEALSHIQLPMYTFHASKFSYIKIKIDCLFDFKMLNIRFFILLVYYVI